MGRTKEISLKVIPGKVANPFMRRHHYSGTVVNNSCLHFGVFLDDRLHGVMSYGPSLNKSKILPLVAGMYRGEKMTLAERHVGKEAANGTGEGNCDEGDSG